MWVEVSRHNFDQRSTHIVWADTRQLFGTAPEEDIYYARVSENGDDEGNPLYCHPHRGRTVHLRAGTREEGRAALSFWGCRGGSSLA